MWSGPRNISTAMMRSWEARGDTAVIDEPFYAFYLKQNDLPHPGADEVIRCHETDPQKIIMSLLEEPAGGKRVSYQKHMAHHILPSLRTDWLADLTNCLLIRDPREMITSLAKVIANPTANETGLPQQARLIPIIENLVGESPIIIDTADVLRDPAGMLRALCKAVNVPYTDRMLHWRAGPRETDGVWAKHWYANVERSTGFMPPRPKTETPPKRLQGVLQECEALYYSLYERRLQSDA